MLEIISFDDVEHSKSLLLQLMSRFYVEGFSESPWCESWSIQAATSELESDTKICDVRLAFIDAKLAGLGVACSLEDYPGGSALTELGVDRNAYYIKELVTASEYRCRGVCSAICGEFSSEAKRLNFNQLALRTRVDNVALFGVVKRIGMIEVGHYQAATGGCESNRLVFAKDL